MAFEVLNCLLGQVALMHVWRYPLKNLQFFWISALMQLMLHCPEYAVLVSLVAYSWYMSIRFDMPLSLICRCDLSMVLPQCNFCSCEKNNELIT
jgi:hypothetical protein